MPLTNAGRDQIAALITATGGTAFSNANAYIGVGDSSTAFATSQTDLQAASNKLRKAMQATYPQVATNVMTFRSSYASGDANYAWNEMAVFNAASAGQMLARVVSAQGTKASGQTWQIDYALTITV